MNTLSVLAIEITHNSRRMVLFFLNKFLTPYVLFAKNTIITAVLFDKVKICVDRSAGKEAVKIVAEL